MHAGQEDFIALLIPAAIALLITVAYFLISGNWTNLGNPIAGVVAIVAGALGLAAGIAVDCPRRVRRSAAAPKVD